MQYYVNCFHNKKTFLSPCYLLKKESVEKSDSEDSSP